MSLPSLFDVLYRFRQHPYTVVQQHVVQLSVRALLSHGWMEEWKENVSLKWIKMLQLIQRTYLSSLEDTELHAQALLANIYVYEVD